MYPFLNARGYNLLPKTEVKLDYTAIHDPIVKSVKRPQKLEFELEKAELPHALTCVVNGTLYVHVVCKKNNQQAFLIVASPESGIIGKCILNLLLEKATKIAHTIIILNHISPQTKSLILTSHELENGQRNIGELILKEHTYIFKLQIKDISRFQILNEDEIKEVEKKYNGTQGFPLMLEQEALARYLGFEKGMVIRILGKDVEYRLVVESEIT